jgi:hypothetical protein
MVMEQLPASANISYDLWVGDPTTGYDPSTHFFMPNSSAFPVPGSPACDQFYAPDPCFVLNEVLVGYQDFINLNYQLSPLSPYHNAGSDGTDPGANVASVQAAVTGVVR